MRRPSGDSDEHKRRLVLSAEPDKCMPTWVAARCTAAAYPYFKGFEWNNEYLLDGGFVVNCPAELAIDETRCLWPDRSMDTLVSVGTGATHVNNDPSHVDVQSQDDLLKVAETAINVVTNSEKLWKDFERYHKSNKDRINRLQPTYGQTFRLDAVKKLDTISKEVEMWLKTIPDQIDLISNQLIAALFFFKPSVLDTQSRTQSGSIECRLPPDLSERKTLAYALKNVASAHQRQLFTVDIPGRDRSGEPIRVAVRLLEDLEPGAELSIPVTFDHLPLIGGSSTIDIKLCSVFGSVEGRYSISGCPFKISK